MKPTTFLITCLLSVSFAAAQSASKVNYQVGMGSSSAYFTKLLGKPTTTRFQTAAGHLYQIPGVAVYRVDERDNKVFKVTIQVLAKNLTPTQVLNQFRLPVKGSAEVSRLSAATTTWKWNSPGIGSNVRSVFLRKSVVESYHTEAQAAGLKAFKDVIYTIIVSGPPPKGGGGGGGGMSLG